MGGMIGCYAVYITQAVFYFRSKTKHASLLWFAALILLLVCNVAGCRSMITAH